MAVANYVRGRGELVGAVQEIESGRKGAKGRPALNQAIADCKRLARDVRFFLEVIDDSGIDIRFADLPDISPLSDEGRMILVSMANFAEFEGRRIGTRTKAALAAAKARGVKLGVTGPANLKHCLEERTAAANLGAKKLAGLVASFQMLRMSQRAMVAELNAIGVPAANRGRWSLIQVQRLISRLHLLQLSAIAERNPAGVIPTCVLPVIQ